VAVLGFGTTQFPGFYVRDSGFEISYSVNTPEDAARVVKARNALDVGSAIVLANPIAEELQLDTDVHAAVLEEALAAAERESIAGNDTTPFLLDYIQRATGGRSLDVNVDVYRGNVALGGAVATALTA
jgi:pseudouridine-5'-phosphate glycosidase